MGLNEDKKKNIVLRISPKLWQDLVEWSEDDFRSLNGQIEYLLTSCVQKRKKARGSDLVADWEDFSHKV